MISIRKAGWASLAFFAFLGFGCDDAASTPAPSPSPVVPSVKTIDVKPVEAKPVDAKPADKKADAAPVKLSADELAEVKKLPEADQKLALAQLICPSSGDNLGGMGMPIKIDLKGTPVFLCCKGCQKDALANPDAMLAKLGKK